MTSFASVDRIEGKYVVVEVELLPSDESIPEAFATKETIMMEIPLEQIPTDLGEIEEGDILVVEHNCENVELVYDKDEEERKRRLKWFWETSFA